MQSDDDSNIANARKRKIIYGWYIYTIYVLLIFNIYMAVYNTCVRHPIEMPLVSVAHSLFIACLLHQILKKRTRFAWVMLVYFIIMRLYYANVLHVEFGLFGCALVLLIISLLLTGTVVIGQMATPPVKQDWLAALGWKQAVALIAIAALVTRLITIDYLS